MDIEGLFQNNNSVIRLKDNYDYYPTFTITDRWLVVWNVYDKTVPDHPWLDRRPIQWSFTFHANREDMKDTLHTIIASDNIDSLEYSLIDLKQSVPCWTTFNAIEPKIDDEYQWVSRDSLGKIISGE